MSHIPTEKIGTIEMTCNKICAPEHIIEYHPENFQFSNLGDDLKALDVCNRDDWKFCTLKADELMDLIRSKGGCIEVVCDFIVILFFCLNILLQYK
jgi:hypothetical protein